jgi:Trp operon repressor
MKSKNTRESNVPKEILFELLTESEVVMVKNRWRVISLLEEGVSVRKIAEEAKVGTDTVVRMSKLLRHNTKVKSFLSKDEKDKSSNSKWVFGKVGREE